MKATNLHESAALEALEYIPLSQFCKLVGWKPSRVHKMIQRGQWRRDAEYVRDGSNRIQVSISGYRRWACSGTQH